MKNAIILAAGKSMRLAPFIYERPKGLFCVKGEILVERQIEQLKEAGVNDICIVVGYMKEKFFYLEKKYGVHLISNNTFSQKGNLYSLYKAKEFLGDTYICCADHYFKYNPFVEENPYNLSYRACSYHRGKFLEFAVNYSDAKVITGFSVGGKDSMAMVGHAYFNAKFSQKFRKLMEEEIDQFGVSNLFWEEFYGRHQKELTLYLREMDEADVLEFDSIDNLCQFDTEFLFNVDSEIISNICKVLKCNPKRIKDIAVIQAGLTNVSFRFSVDGVPYVYRHPGGTARSLVDRYSEMYAQQKAKELGVDKSVIHIDPAGWKLSYLVTDLAECDFRKYPDQLEKGMAYLRKIHKAKLGTENKIKNFNTVAEGKRLMEIACAVKGNLFAEFHDLIEKVERLNELTEVDAKQQKMERVLCHNDTYEPNYLVTKDDEMYLIDWEYAGLNYPANDLACILCRGEFTEEQIEGILRVYLERQPSKEERRFYIAYIALCGFYWFCWGLYKGSVGDDDSFFFLPAYRNCNRFIDVALKSYTENENK